MKKFLLKLLMGASLTTSVFIFQACYGPAIPPDFDEIQMSETQMAPSDEEAAVPEAPETQEAPEADGQD
ncbi:MAG: hypothetical protein IK145_01745 [Bacteroidales bacterium]|nr:hypothetical protein [Bacteroidales bacterium]